MNYLAHLFFSPRGPTLVGNLLADFTRDRSQLPPAILPGFHLHWHIDEFTDSHPEVITGRKFFTPNYRKYSWVLLDIFYDHFLSLHWNHFHSEPLEVFTIQVQRELEPYRELFPPRLMAMFQSLKRHNWLARYGEWEELERVLSRLENRVNQSIPLAESLLELKENYRELEDGFLAFFPELVDSVEQWRGAGSKGNPQATPE